MLFIPNPAGTSQANGAAMLLSKQAKSILAFWLILEKRTWANRMKVFTLLETFTNVS